MMLDINRLRGSDFDATLDDSAWRAGLNLWMTAWHQVPAASLSPDEASLAKAAGLGRDVKSWRKVKGIALRGWSLADDGLLYHEVVAELALERWIDKLGQRLSSEAGNATRYGHEFDPSALYAEILAAAELLTSLNPKSKTLSKQHVKKAAKASTGSPTEPPTIPPSGSPTGVPREEKVREEKVLETTRQGARTIQPSDPPTRAELDALETLIRQAAGAAINVASPKLKNLATILGLTRQGAGPPCDIDADIIPTIRARSARAPPGTVNSWDYYRDAIAEARDRRLTGAPAQETRHEQPPRPDAKLAARQANHARALAGADLASRLRGES